MVPFEIHRLTLPQDRALNWGHAKAQVEDREVCLARTISTMLDRIAANIAIGKASMITQIFIVAGISGFWPIWGWWDDLTAVTESTRKTRTRRAW